MRQILIIGAGRSSGNLISYLASLCEINNWQIRLGDYNFSLAERRATISSFITPFKFDISNEQQLLKEVSGADIVVSMVPAHMHFPVAKICVQLKKHMITASYVSPEIKTLHEKAVQNNILILMECGLDPGLDHISAMKVINEIKSQGGVLTLFKSFTGGLIAPECSNLWDYKFTWNPRNVVLAGQGVSKFVRNGKYKYIPYHRLFSRIEEVHIDGFGTFEAYANRDSLKYRDLYGISEIPTLFRGTLREKDFCAFWDVFVQLGMTDDSYFLEDVEKMTYRAFLNSFLPYSEKLLVEEKFKAFFAMNEKDARYLKIERLGFFENKMLELSGEITPAMVLQEVLMQKWGLENDDRDMVVMQHQFEYTLQGKQIRKISSLGMKGETGEQTSMSKLVGLPVALAVEGILLGEISETGVQIPVISSIYNPILKKMQAYGVSFVEREEEVS